MHRIVILVFFFLLLSYNIFAQLTVKEVGDEVCDCLEANKHLPDSVKIFKCIDIIANATHFNNKESEIDYFLKETEKFLNKNCLEYLKYSSKNTQFSSKEWTIADTMPNSKLSLKDFEAFKQIKRFYYFEANGDTTFVEIRNGIWFEKMKNGRYQSELKIRYTETNQFELEYIKSNHPVKESYSKVGDRYKYRILEKKDDYYILASERNSVVYKFSLFFNK